MTDVRALGSADESGQTPGPRYIADFSLSLINRTGAYYVARDLVEELHPFFPIVRYWRMLARQQPAGLLRRVLGRAMLAELAYVPETTALARRRLGALPILFLDPLYVLRSSLAADDIVLCHDIGPVTHPQLFQTRTVELYARAYDCIRREGPGLVFVSAASRAEFVARFGAGFRFLEVIPLYVRTPVAQGEAVAPPGVVRPFILTVGALEVRKNHLRIMEAFAASGLRERGYRYVIGGPRGNSAREVEAAALRTPGVVRLGYLSDPELRWLYANASAFVLPSLLEGFGIPALEAALHGLVSIVSRGGAQAEAAGESAITVDPLSVADIARALREVADMPAEALQRRGGEARTHALALTRERFLSGWTQLLRNSPRRTSEGPDDTIAPAC